MVMLAISADQAIQSINTVKPDAILLDLRLKGIRGLAVARQCREDPGTRNIPILAVTAYSNEYDERAAAKAGCDAYITKPINIHTLSQQIEAVVAAKAKQVSAETQL